MFFDLDRLGPIRQASLSIDMGADTHSVFYLHQCMPLHLIQPTSMHASPSHSTYINVCLSISMYNSHLTYINVCLSISMYNSHSTYINVCLSISMYASHSTYINVPVSLHLNVCFSFNLHQCMSPSQCVLLI